MTKSKELIQEIVRVVVPPSKILLAIALLWLILRSLDIVQLAEAFSSISWSAVLESFGILFICNILNVYKWKVVSGALGIDVSFMPLLRAYFAGLFSSNFLPSVFGGDLVRVWIVPSRYGSSAEIGVSVLLDRLISLCTLFLLCFVCSILASIRVPFLSTHLIWVSAVFPFLIIGLLLSPVLRRCFLVFCLERFPVGQTIDRVLSQGSNHKQMMILALVIGEAAQLLSVSAFSIVLAAMGYARTYWDIGLVVSLVVIGTMLPVTINGIGVRENLSIALFALVGVPVERALTITLIIFLCGLTISLAGLGPTLTINKARRG